MHVSAFSMFTILFRFKAFGRLDAPNSESFLFCKSHADSVVASSDTDGNIVDITGVTLVSN